MSYMILNQVTPSTDNWKLEFTREEVKKKNDAQSIYYRKWLQ